MFGEKLVNEYPSESYRFLETHVEEDIAYLKQVELEFMAEVDGLLEMFNLSHLRVNA